MTHLLKGEKTLSQLQRSGQTVDLLGLDGGTEFNAWKNKSHPRSDALDAELLTGAGGKAQAQKQSGCGEATKKKNVPMSLRCCI